jgi:hypothetical protein
VAELLTGGGSRSNSGHCWRRGRGWRPREASWRRGEATGGFGRGCGAAAERRSHGGAVSSVRWSKVATVLELGGGCGVAVGHREGLRERLKGPIKGEAGDLGVRAPMGIEAVIRAGVADHNNGSA